VRRGRVDDAAAVSSTPLQTGHHLLFMRGPKYAMKNDFITPNAIIWIQQALGSGVGTVISITELRDVHNPPFNIQKLRE